MHANFEHHIAYGAHPQEKTKAWLEIEKVA